MTESGAARRPRLLLWMLLVAGVTALPAPLFIHAPFNTADEALLVVYAEEFMGGRLPGADFFTVYGPGGFATLAGAFHVFGVSVAVERLVGLGYRLAVVAGVMFLVDRYGTKVSVVAGLTCGALALSSGLTAFAWFGGLALSIWSLGLLMRSAGHASAFAAGVLGGLASAWRLEMIVLNTAAIPLLWGDRRARSFVAGLAVGSLPTVLWLVVAGRVAVENVILSRMAVNAQLELSQVALGIWVVLGASVVLTGAVLVQGARSRNRELLALGLLCLLVLPQAFQRVDSDHTIFTLCIILPIAVAYASVLGWVTPSRDLTSKQRGRLTLAGGLASALMAATVAIMVSTTPVTRVTYDGRTIPVAKAERADLISLLAAVAENVPEGSKLFVGAQDMSVPTLTEIRFYHLLREYEHPWFYLELPPGVAEVRDSPLAGDVSEADALILTDVPEDLRESLFPHIPDGSEEVNRLVAEEFCLVDRVGINRIYRRCADGEGG